MEENDFKKSSSDTITLMKATSCLQQPKFMDDEVNDFLARINGTLSNNYFLLQGKFDGFFFFFFSIRFSLDQIFLGIVLLGEKFV